jgi:hypothetical protein
MTHAARKFDHMDAVVAAYDELMASYAHDAMGRVVIDLADGLTIERRAALRAFIDEAGGWALISDVRRKRAAGEID